jgi:hypothetical protein
MGRNKGNWKGEQERIRGEKDGRGERRKRRGKGNNILEEAYVV